MKWSLEGGVAMAAPLAIFRPLDHVKPVLDRYRSCLMRS